MYLNVLPSVAWFVIILGMCRIIPGPSNLIALTFNDTGRVIAVYVI